MDVSVVIPTYNRASMVGDAIESALAQTHPIREVIVVDDGSTDDTERVVRAFGAPVRYLRQENRGVGAARNAAMASARGGALAFLDSDDLWYPFKVEAQVAVLEALPEVGLVHSEFDILKDDGTTRSQGGRSWFAVPTDPATFYTSTAAFRELYPDGGTRTPDFTVRWGSIYRTLLDEALVLTSTVMVRRGILDAEARFTEGVTIFEDWEFFARVCRRHDAAFMDVSTTVNKGHTSPDRVTSCSHLARAQCYLAMVERIWKADPSFLATHGDGALRAEGNALLAVAREAILASDRARARAALSRWRRLGTRSRAAWAHGYAACTVLPAGATLLRQLLRARTLWRLLSLSERRGYSVNPSA